MGAGAGVNVSCREFTRIVKVKPPKGGKDALQIYMGDCMLKAYDWSMKCTRPGFLVVEDVKEKLKDLSWVDSHRREEIGSFDASKAEFFIGYGQRIEFTIGGGYTRTVLGRGAAVELGSQYGYDLGLEVTVPGRTTDGRKCELSGLWYPERFTFMASDQFVDMYEWCWENRFGDEWDEAESMFNDASAYGQYGFELRSGNLKSIFRRRKKEDLYDEWTVGRKNAWSFERCPKCGAYETEKQISVIRRRGEYPQARENVNFHCRKCGTYWKTAEVMNDRKVVHFNRKDRK